MHKKYSEKTKLIAKVVLIRLLLSLRAYSSTNKIHCHKTGIKLCDKTKYFSSSVPYDYHAIYYRETRLTFIYLFIYSFFSLKILIYDLSNVYSESYIFNKTCLYVVNIKTPG